MKQEASQLLQAVVEYIFPGKDFGALVTIEQTDEKFGEYASNIAMVLAGREKVNPRALAEKIVTTAGVSPDFATLDIAGPGFINIRFSDAYLERTLAEDVLLTQKLAGQVVLMEFSDPNPFKQLHVGHLYTSIVGDTLSRFNEALGADVKRLNFGGDVGQHVAKSICGMRLWCGGELDYDKIAQVDESSRPAWLSQVYVTGNQAYESDPAIKTEIVALNKKIYQVVADNDRSSVLGRVYWLTRQWSYDYFEQFYQTLGLEFDKYYPESVTAPVGEVAVREQIENGVYEHSDGAVVFRGEKFGLHTRVFINKEGLPTYETKDIGLSLMKEADYNPDQSVIITADEQKEYMKVVLKSIEQYRPDLAAKTNHITHGLVKRPGGIKMSSRQGNGLMAVDVIDDVRAVLAQRDEQVDEKIVLSAIKYTFLTQKIGGDIIFDPEETVSLQGNSGPYIQYALVRAKSILAKVDSQSTSQKIDQTKPGDAMNTHERSIARKLALYEDILEGAAVKMQPHILTQYIFELAQTFNRFYENAPVLGNERSSFRISVVNKYTLVLTHAFELLGLDEIERM